MATLKTGRFRVKKVGSSSIDEKHIRRRRSFQHRGSPTVPLTVTVYNVQRILPIDLDVAKHCVILDDPVEMCEKNCEITERLCRSDLAQIWRLLGEIARAATKSAAEDTGCPWSKTPLGINLLQSIVRHYLESKDFQTIALIVCTFTHHATRKQEVSPTLSGSSSSSGRERFWFLRPGALTGTTSSPATDSPYHTIHAGNYETVVGFPVRCKNGGSDPNLERFNTRNTRSNSWTESLQEEEENTKALLDLGSGRGPDPLELGEPLHGLLAKEDIPVYVDALNLYANVLYNWKQQQTRCQVLKHGGCSPTEISTCQQCSKPAASSGHLCSTCASQPAPFTCEICRLPVRGLASFCSGCGHGGHTLHMLGWFKVRNVCPSGCGCCCPSFMATPPTELKKVDSTALTTTTTTTTTTVDPKKKSELISGSRFRVETNKILF